jgi:uncharacterized membrane protein
MAIALLSLGGVFVALYLLAYWFGWTGPLICGVGDCGTVQASEHARIGTIPVAGIGLAGYLALLGASLLGLQPAWATSRALGGLLLAGSAVGVAFSAYFTYLEAYVIHAWCQWCVVSAVLMTLIFLAALPEARGLLVNNARNAPPARADSSA